MAVYRRGYDRYQGRLTGRMSRLLVLPRFAWSRLLQQRLVVMLLIVSTFWPAACIVFVYLANHTELLLGLGGGPLLNFLKIDARFFVVFMTERSVFTIVLAAFAGPSLIAPDLANGALPLYFSRPFSRWEYVSARMLALAGVLSLITWVPGLLLFTIQSSMAGWTWLGANWRLGAGVLLGFPMWILFVGLVALASSAYVKWRVVGGALVVGFFFVSAGATELAAAILRVDWPRALDPALAMNQIWRAMLGAEPNAGPDAWECLFAIAVMTALLLWVLERRIRPVEVVT